MTPTELHGAIVTVLEASGYEVQSEVAIHGAKIDILARRKGAPIPETYCIECTVSHVDVDKLGKDSTHFLVVQKHFPHYHCVMISALGFAPLTRERAQEGGIHCWTFAEFRKMFIATVAYEEFVVGPSERDAVSAAKADPNLPRPLWQELRDLEYVYQEPSISIKRGRAGSPPSAPSDKALGWFDTWLESPTRHWVSLIGDYGTGKTALTKVLLLRWMRKFRIDGKFLPIRIELRDFATKFDYEGLIIHFWRRHGLDTLPLRALEMLIEEGRVVFLLDGYDEMAQNLSIIDRRNCLLALTKAISGKSTGLITSRPNYFTEAEELRVVELLYGKGKKLHRLDQIAVAQETDVDALLQRYYLERQDARMADLTRDQVDRLLERRLGREPQMLANVQALIGNIYGLPAATTSTEQALATKPVVVTYLLDIAENLTGIQLDAYRPLDDWGIFMLILDKLVLRDAGRTSGIVTQGERRQFLQRLAVALTAGHRPYADREMMLELVHALFGREIRRAGEGDIAAQEELYFADLRSSASLTSSEERWGFSHSSLREFLVAEAFVEAVVSAPAGSLKPFAGIEPSQGTIRFLAAAFAHRSDFFECLKVAIGTDPEVVLNVHFAPLPAVGPG